MKVSMEFDLTPKEMRKLMGLPDVEAMQEKMVDIVFTELQKSIKDIKDPEKLWQRFMPMGAQGLDQLQKFVPDFIKRRDDDEAEEEEEKGN